MESFERLYNIIVKLRSSDGCPWDNEQTPTSLRGDLIEECYELIDAIDNNDIPNIREEIGDLYLLTTMIAYMHEQEGYFAIQDSLNEISDKLIRRHPHVFSETTDLSVDEVLVQWDDIKKNLEGKIKPYILDTVKKGFPPLEKAMKLQKKAAKNGFDWIDEKGPMDKIREEIIEIENTTNSIELEEECGDLLFAVINYCRKTEVNPVLALNKTNNKFTERFNYIESQMKKINKPLCFDNIETMEDFWAEKKNIENQKKF